MKAAQLRQAILQAAVQGKLVPQNVHDEPASELLARIRQEKARLIKDGKIKKEKPLPPISADDVPYDLPEGWVWCRLGDITTLITSGSRDWAKFYAKEGAIFLRMGNLSKDSFNLRLHSIQHVSPPANSEGNRTKLEANDILVSITGDVGSLGRIPQDFGAAYINQHTALVRFPVELQNEYFPYAFLSPFCKNQFDEPQRGIKNSFRLTDLSYMFIPLPPLAEQQRIAVKIDELMALCDDLETDEKELDKLEADFAEYLPKSILQAAVQGKLVSQNVHDEPASELLARIRQEKARLIKEGKIKKEKPLPPIVEDEVPYDLPDGWIWCRLGELFYICSSRRVHQSDWRSSGIPFYRAREIAVLSEHGHVDNDLYITNTLYEGYKRSSGVPTAGDLMVTAVGTLGKTYIVKEEDVFYYKDASVICFHNFAQLNSRYFKYLMSTPLMKMQIEADSAGTTVGTLTIIRANNYLAPLPPLAEQQRIVAKVDELMTLCDELKRSRDIPLESVPSNIVPFPAWEDETEELAFAARGDMRGLSDEAMRDIDELFGDDADD